MQTRGGGSGLSFRRYQESPRRSFCHRCKNFPVVLANCRFSRNAVLAYALLCCSGEGSLLPFLGRVEREKKVMEPENSLPSFRHSYRGGGLTHAAASGEERGRVRNFDINHFAALPPFPPLPLHLLLRSETSFPPKRVFFHSRTLCAFSPFDELFSGGKWFI